MLRSAMSKSPSLSLPPGLSAELEQKYFWWEPIGTQPRSEARILAQAMEFASFADIKRIEREIDQEQLVELMRLSEPGWFSEKSWEFWRGRLAAATGQSIPDQRPRRSLDAEAL